MLHCPGAPLHIVEGQDPIGGVQHVERSPHVPMTADDAIALVNDWTPRERVEVANGR